MELETGGGRGSELVANMDLAVTVVGGDPSDSGMITGSSGALNKEMVVFTAATADTQSTSNKVLCSWLKSEC